MPYIVTPDLTINFYGDIISTMKKNESTIVLICILVVLAVTTGMFFVLNNKNSQKEIPSSATATTAPSYEGLSTEDLITQSPSESLTEAASAALTESSTQAATSEAASTAVITEAQTAATTERTTFASPEKVDVAEFNRFTKILYAFGFLYDAEQNIFYSAEDPWQRNFGFSEFYDSMAAFGNMIYDTVRFKFSYGEHDWMLQLWKGRYGITSGAEMGVYTKPRGQINEFYNCAEDENHLGMEFELYRYDQLFFTRGPLKHWWLTGFRLGDVVYSDALTMKAIFHFDNKEIADAFESAAISQVASRNDLRFTRNGLDFTVYWGPNIELLFGKIQ